jgi:hypothetical protein
LNNQRRFVSPSAKPVANKKQHSVPCRRRLRLRLKDRVKIKRLRRVLQGGKRVNSRICMHKILCYTQLLEQHTLGELAKAAKRIAAGAVAGVPERLQRLAARVVIKRRCVFLLGFRSATLTCF